MDVITGQGEQSVGRAVDVGMAGTQGGSGIDHLDGPCFWDGGKGGCDDGRPTEPGSLVWRWWGIGRP